MLLSQLCHPQRRPDHRGEGPEEAEECSEGEVMPRSPSTVERLIKIYPFQKEKRFSSAHQVGGFTKLPWLSASEGGSWALASWFQDTPFW